MLKASFIGVLLLGSQTALAEAMEDFPLSDSPLFVTPSNLGGSFETAPNAITRIEIDDLKNLGINSIVDALRFVTGMQVSDIHGANSVVGYHGANVNAPRRMEVLYNGTSIYRAGFASVNWHSLPFVLDDLSAIEVVRGSSVVDYGANAFVSAINLIPKSKALEPGFSVELMTGTNGIKQLILSNHFEIGRGHYNFRYFHTGTKGFDTDKLGQDIDDATSGNGIVLSGESLIAKNTLFDFNLNISEFQYNPGNYSSVTADNETVQIANSLFTQLGETKELSSSFTAKLTNTREVNDRVINISGGVNAMVFERKQDIVLCAPVFAFDPLIAQLDASPNVDLVFSDVPFALQTAFVTGFPVLNESIVAPLSVEDIVILNQIGDRVQTVGPAAYSRDICGDTTQNVDERRVGFDLKVASNDKDQALNFASVLRANRSFVSSQTYLDGSISVNSYSFSNNLRYQFTENLVGNAGAMIEYNDQLSDRYYSHRLALNYTIKDHHVIRALYSESERSPDIYELNRFWSYRVRYNNDVDILGNSEGTLFRSETSPSFLKPENIVTHEVGYTYFSANTVLDIKLFNEKYTDLISGRFLYFDYFLDNSGELEQSGFELQFERNSPLIPGWKYGASYLHMNSNTETGFENTLRVDNVSTLWTIVPLHDDLFLGVTGFYSEDVAGEDYKRLDVALSYYNHVGDYDYFLRFNYRRYPENINSYTEFSVSDPLSSSYSSRDHFLLSFGVSY